MSAQPGNPLVSAALIVRDEEPVLEECLESIRSVVDEIIVVDTGSVDDTPKIAERNGALVFHQPWTGNFSAARNTGLELCRGQWILYIDADERLAPTTRTTMEALLVDAREVAFRVLLRPFVGATPYREYRLWRNDPRIRFEGAIHEKVVPSIHAVAEMDHRSISPCDLLLEHIGYEGDQTHKHRRNLPLLRRQLERDPDNLFNWHHLARALSGLGELEESERALMHSIELTRAKSSHDPTGVLAYVDLVALRHGRGVDADELLAEALQRYPANWVLRWLEARMLVAAGQYNEALAPLDALASVDRTRLPDEGPAYDERLFGEFPQDTRGFCFMRLGRYADAAAAYADALRHSPGNLAYMTKRRLALARASHSAGVPAPGEGEGRTDTRVRVPSEGG